VADLSIRICATHGEPPKRTTAPARSVAALAITKIHTSTAAAKNATIAVLPTLHLGHTSCTIRRSV
jgi:hypothetical protein